MSEKLRTILGVFVALWPLYPALLLCYVISSLPDGDAAQPWRMAFPVFCVSLAVGARVAHRMRMDISKGKLARWRDAAIPVALLTGFFLLFYRAETAFPLGEYLRANLSAPVGLRQMVAGLTYGIFILAPVQRLCSFCEILEVENRRSPSSK